jgi:pyrimidine deaminase RibD-like protein
MKCSKCGRKSESDLCPPCLKTLELEGKRVGKKVLVEAMRKRRESFEGKGVPRLRKERKEFKPSWMKDNAKH